MRSHRLIPVTAALMAFFAFQATAATPPQAGYQHVQIGRTVVTALSDGTIALAPHKLLTNTTAAHVKARLAEHFHGEGVDISVNAYLFRTGPHLVLVDAGAGDLFGPTLNKLPASLKAAGVAPEEITDILISHIHTDHTGGLTNASGRVFPNARLHLDQRELDYWMNRSNRDKAADAARKNFDDAEAKIQPYLDAGKVTPFNGASVVLPGVRSIPTPGHTPGHSLYALESNGEKLVFWGDLMHIAEVQMAEPEVTIAFDVDPRAAAIARKKAFADAANGNYMIAADHIAFPGLGHLRKERHGYSWVAAPYSNDAALGRQ